MPRRRKIDAAPRGLTADLVRDAFARYGHHAYRWLGCSRQAIGNPRRPELAAAAAEGRAVWITALAERLVGRVLVRVNVPAALGEALAARAAAEWTDRSTWCERALEGLATLPEVERPRVEGRFTAAGTDDEHGRAALQLRLPGDLVRRWRAAYGLDIGLRLRAALAEAVKA